MRRGLVLAAVLFAVTGCTGSLQVPPAFVQAYGTIDSQCAPSQATASLCTAHVYLINHGGEGMGHATIAVALTARGAAATSARTTTSARCGRSIPDTPSGGEVDLTCTFDLPAGSAIAGTPILQSVDFAAATGTGSSVDGAGVIAALGLAIVAALLGVIAVIASLERRGPGSRQPRPHSDGDDSW